MSSKNIPALLLSFSKKEKIAALILLAAIIIALLLPATGLLYSHQQPNNIDTAWMAAIRKLQQQSSMQDEKPDPKSPYVPQNHTPQSYTLSPFDPNTATAETLKKLGLRDKTIQTIINYRSKGGHFRQPGDLKKIYGLRQEEFERLQPYIIIAAAGHNARQDWGNNNWPRRERKAERPIDINAADTTAWQSLYGIGSKLAARIVNFREKLGGFYNIAQVGETFGLPDSTYQHIRQYLRLSNAAVKKININTAGYEALEAHPYISKKLAYQIVKLRKTTGTFQAITAIGPLADGQYDNFEKLSHYITTE